MNTKHNSSQLGVTITASRTVPLATVSEEAIATPLRRRTPSFNSRQRRLAQFPKSEPPNLSQPSKRHRSSLYRIRSVKNRQKTDREEDKSVSSLPQYSASTLNVLPPANMITPPSAENAEIADTYPNIEQQAQMSSTYKVQAEFGAELS